MNMQAIKIRHGNALRLLAALLLLAFVLSIGQASRAANDDDEVWLMVKAGERRLELVGDYSYRMDGGGQVDFKDGGRVIELPEGLTILVNDKKIEGEQRVRESESVRVVNSRGEQLWTLSPVRRQEMSW
ncbi:MAG TPA: hypothetical protein VJS44_03645 [Pyrinomonadaceae bacterium]|nr:hypothetical protein [Pyrinomonadaceae bacterium]